jgi:hypothetical protein
MDSFSKLKDNIMSHADLTRREASGWYSLHCPVCQNNRITGGFLFEEDHIIYKCFRASCPSDTGLERNGRVSRKFKTLMETLGVSIPIDLLTQRSKIQNQIEKIEDSRFKEHAYKSIKIEDDHVPLEDETSSFARRWIKTLNERRFDLNKVFLFTGGKYKNLPFVKFFHHNRLIGYQVISNDKYITETGGNTNLVYLTTGYVPDPCIIVEGVADAMVFPNTVAILGDHLTKEQAYVLRSAKEWIFLPDRSGNRFIQQMKEYKQKIVIPDWEYEDLNEAVCSVGPLVVARKMRDGLIDNHNKARVKYEFWRTTTHERRSY